MSRINDLIKEMCPNGVEFKSLKEVFDIFSGMTGVTNKWAEEGNCQFIDYMNAYKNNKIDITNLPYATVKNINQIILVQGDLLLTSASEVPDECAIASVIEDKIQDGVFMDDHLFGLRLKDEYKNIINTTFISYYLNSKPFRCNLFKAVRGVTRFYISNKDYMKLNIPIPPIEIQKEIVRILDKFGELEAELEAELEVRKSQYEFWRGKLLKGTKRYKLDDIAKFTYGLTDKALESGTARYIRITDISEDGYLLDNDCKYLNITDDNSKYVLNKGDLVVARTGASYGKTLYFDSDDPGIYASFLIKIELDNNIILNRYYWHFSKSALYWNQANNLVSKAGQPQFNSNAIKKLEIDIPSIEEQECIISILDKFDKLINDISIGLPAEIELRRKQYEYYRNKLLSFEELSVSE